MTLNPPAPVYHESPGTLHFEYSTRIQAPVERVFAFHEQPDAFQKLVPPWQKVAMVRRRGGLETGALLEFDLIVGFWGIRWVAQHIAYEKDHLFVDEQVRGPLKLWIHAHVFNVEDGITRLTDLIDYELPGGRLVNRLLGPIVQFQLRRMFRYRHEVTRRACE